MLVFLMAIEDLDAADRISLLYRRYRKMLCEIAYRKTGSREDAEDAVNDVFTNLIRSGKLQSLDEHSAKALLIVAVRNHAVNAAKRNSYRVHEKFSDEINARVVSSEPELLEDLQEAIARLPKELSEELILFYFQGYTTAEIAEMHKVKQDTVQKRIKRSRELLKEMLSEDDRK